MEAQTIEKQEASIGKALWHQVTTVVILWDKKFNPTKMQSSEKL